MAISVTISTANLQTFVVIKGMDPKSPQVTFLMRAIQDLWQQNVKRFFSRHETHYMYRNDKSKSSGIEDIFHCYTRRGDIIGAISTAEAKYVNYLIYGAPPGKGKYVPAIGGRVKYGTWRGIPTTYWMTWQSFFKQGVYSLISEFGFEEKKKPKRKPDVKGARAAAVAQVRQALHSMEGTYDGYI